MALAQESDVTSRWIGEALAPEVLAVIAVRLNDAELIIKGRVADLLARAADNEDFRNTVIMIESEMVLRLVRNPEGYSQESDGNYSYAIYQRVSSGKLELLPEELGMLLGGDGMYVISPRFPDYPSPEGAYDPTKPWPPPWWLECE